MSEIKLPSGIEITGKLGEVVIINHAPPNLCKGDKVFTADQMRAAILEERERCAKVCEQTDEDGEGPDCWGWHSKDYASAIRGK